MVFWWTGRGFLSLLFLIGVFGVFGAVVTLTVGDAAFQRWPWLWGVGLLLASVANWVGGARMNHTSVNPLTGSIRDRLTYRPKNRFLSLPMELWSAPVSAFAILLILKGLL